MFVAELTPKDLHIATIIASMDGMMAVLPLNELKTEVKRAPEAVFKVNQLVTRHAMATFSHNLNGTEHNPYIHHMATAQMTKRLREFYTKNPQIRAFLNGADKKDEKFIIQAMRNTEVETAERVIRQGAWDRSFLIVTSGKLMAFKQNGDNEIYEEGAIIGIEQFLFNKQWADDLICASAAVISKVTWDSMQDMVRQNALAASRLYKCVMRHYCYAQLYDSGRKIENQHLFNHGELSDTDLMIDFKLDLRSAADPTHKHLFNMLAQARRDPPAVAAKA